MDLNPMWWLVSLVIAGAVIYYLVASRGEIRDGRGRRLATPGADEEVGEELSGEIGDVVAGIEDDENFVNPGLGNDDSPTTPLINLDVAAGVASRGMGGIADEDEEYAADLDASQTLTDRKYDDGYGDDEDEEVYTEDEPYIEGEREDRLADETYMRADDVKRETRNDDRKVREFRRRDRR